ncbi:MULTISPECIES: DUF4350 domain-containing protein [Microbacterium]|uniref:DUF4350 domain-containing protein n=1 Tax=Microbacterium TaxID=33882 RepID=UPI00217E33AA|nr:MULTISPECIES: DUF4350 domain-containing protein [Microbacterium]UWF78207.1 DUF4350 domain-containing protein [Microbacterium neungamense]WCM56379.1 DUF4350 domain-containing protein [Microbacterium sp. EF45047]
MSPSAPAARAGSPDAAASASGDLAGVTGTAAPDAGSAASVPAIAASTAVGPPRGRGRRLLGWLFVLLLLLGVALVSLRFTATAPTIGGMLNPDGRNPQGARALAEILRQQDIEVTVARTRAEVRDALRPDSTLAMTDPYPLSDEAVQELIQPADRVVFLSTSARLLELTGLGEDAFGAPQTVDAGCDLAEFARVGEIAPDRMFRPAPGVAGCFADADGDAAVLVADDPRIAVVEGRRLFDNEHLAENGNAALGLALLGQTGHVVWYVPSFEDSDRVGDPEETLGSLTPEWVTPAIVLLALAALAAIAWRGRRFGPLVTESLPVTVRASETMHGRARLTARAGDAAHAAEAIRTGTVLRLGRRLGLSARASAVEVADAASDRLRVPRGSLHQLLAGPPPAGDADLVDLARKLAELEAAVDAAVHTERNVP